MAKALVTWNHPKWLNYPFYKDMTATFKSNSTVCRIPELARDLDYFDFDNLLPMPRIITESPTFAECCDRTAVRMLEEAKHKKMIISWSGGIDSTAIIVAVLKNGYDKNIHDISVTLTRESIDEYPSLFYKHILPNFKLLTYDIKGMYAQGLLYTGDLGDQVFGSQIILAMVPMYGSEYLLKPYQDTVPHFWSLASGAAGKRMFEHYHPIVDYCPFPVKTTFDFLWWWNFSQKWQHCRYRLLLWGDAENLKYGKNLRSFYEDDYFQMYAMTRHEEKIRHGVLSTYKMPAKQYIIDYTKDEAYYNKLKHMSIHNKKSKKVLSYILNTDYEFVQDDVENYLNRDKKGGL